jgi:ribosome biogenesis GTPase
MKEQGRILSLSGGLYTVKTPAGLCYCRAKGAFRKEGLHPTTGDLVLVETEHSTEKKDDQGQIVQILDRKNILIRPPLANLDTLFLVVAAKDPDPVLLSIDKMLSIARHNEIRAVLVFTKRELDPEGAKELCARYRSSGFDAVCVSKEDPRDMQEQIFPFMQGTICALAGASGVGKSSLLNSLFPSLSAEIGRLSDKTHRGRHTTRQSTLYPISTYLGREEEIYLADTPGFSLLDFQRFFFMKTEDLAFTFPEFEPFLGNCQFSKCTHRKEVGCRILEELEKGHIARSRHENYVALYEELSRTKNWELGKKKTRR